MENENENKDIRHSKERRNLIESKGMNYDRESLSNSGDIKL